MRGKLSEAFEANAMQASTMPSIAKLRRHKAT